MSILRLPTGLSFEQAKKDAKALSKENHISLSVAQNQIAKKHSRSTWAEATARVKSYRSELLPIRTLYSNKTPFRLRKTRDMVVLHGYNMRERRELFIALIEKQLKSNIPVLMIMQHGSINPSSIMHDAWWDAVNRFSHEVKRLQGQYKELLRIHLLKGCMFDGGVISGNGIDALMLNGATLAVDEWDVDFFDREPLLELMNASKYTIISTSTLHLYRENERFFQDQYLYLCFVLFEGAECGDQLLEWCGRDLVEKISALVDELGISTEFILVRTECLERHRLMFRQRPSTPQRRTEGSIVEGKGFERPYMPPAVSEAVLLDKYKKYGLDTNMATIRLHPTLFVSDRVDKPRLNHFSLTIDIPQLDVHYVHKGKFVRPYRNDRFIRTDVPLFFQVNNFAWIRLDELPLDIIYRWKTKGGIEVTHTIKALLVEPIFEMEDDEFDGVNFNFFEQNPLHPLGHTYQIDERKHFTFHDWTSVVKRHERELTGEAREDAVMSSERVNLGVTEITSKGLGVEGFVIKEEFECERAIDLYLSSNDYAFL